MPAPCSHRRRFIKAIGLLVLGAMINVGVVWGLALTVTECIYDDDDVIVTRWERSATNTMMIAYSSQRPGWIGFYDGMAMDILYEDGAPLPRTYETPDWAGSALASRVDSISLIQGWGWPSISMWCALVDDDATGTVSLIGAVPTPLPSMAMGSCRTPRVLPFNVIWPGFAINTVFYAGVLWVLFAGPFALRRMSRLKRGLCPTCAYPFGSSDVCTEWGRPR